MTSPSKIHRTLAAVFVAAIAIPSGPANAQDPAPLPSVTLPPELDRVLRDYERHWREGNPEELAALFTEDGFVMSPRQPPLRGRQKIREKYASTGGNLTLRAIAFHASDSVAYIIGAYRYDPEGSDTGKFVLALRKNPSGRWLIAADMDSSNS